MENKNVAAFVKVVEFNNFTRAAESLGYSQAAVTAQIKTLEKELGVPLFDRIGKSIRLTQEGRTFLPYALDLLRAEEAALHSVRPAAELSGELRLCSASSYAAEVLPGILLAYLRLHPRVQVTVKVSDYPETTTRMLARGEIDFLAEVGDELAYPDFLQAGKRSEPMVFVTYPENPLLKKNSITVADVIRDRFVMADIDIAGYSTLLVKELRQRELTVEPALVLGSVEGVLNVLRGGFGVSFIPRYAAAGYLNSGELALIPVRDLEINVCSWFLYSPGRWLNPVMREFIRIVEEYGG
ncbi:MAG: LysR family transcriptional regulator [Firmicutes bacterium]|nr:LysR family transcriptional regulator [Bacillota bacterium]